MAVCPSAKSDHDDALSTKKARVLASSGPRTINEPSRALISTPENLRLALGMFLTMMLLH